MVHAKVNILHTTLKADNARNHSDNFHSVVPHWNVAATKGLKMNEFSIFSFLQSQNNCCLALTIPLVKRQSFLWCKVLAGGVADDKKPAKNTIPAFNLLTFDTLLDSINSSEPLAFDVVFVASQGEDAKFGEKNITGDKKNLPNFTSKNNDSVQVKPGFGNDRRSGYQKLIKYPENRSATTHKTWDEKNCDQINAMIFKKIESHKNINIKNSGFVASI